MTKRTQLSLVGSAALLVACGGNSDPVGSVGSQLATATLTDVGLGGVSGGIFDMNASQEMIGVYETAGTVHAFRKHDSSFSDIHPSGSTSSWVTTINAAGDVGGSVTDATGTHAAVWLASAGGAEVVASPGTGWSNISRMNASAQAVGTWMPFGYQRAFFWSAAGGMVDLGDLGGDRMIAHEINALGQIVGWSTELPGNNTLGRAISWQDGVLTDLGTLGGEFSGADDVNDGGLVVGSAQTSTGVWHACQWVDGVIVDLDPWSTDESYAMAVNEAGHVVGFRIIGGQRYATLWRDGGAIDLGGGPGSMGVDIDDLGVVTGMRLNGPGFIWSNPADGVVEMPPPAGTTMSVIGKVGDGIAVGSGLNNFPYLFPGGRPAVWTLDFPPPAPADAIGVLDDAVDDSPLDTAEANALDNKLQSALASCENGNEGAARNKIHAFIHQVQAFVHSGRLTEQEGQDLIALANAVLDALDC